VVAWDDAGMSRPVHFVSVLFPRVTQLDLTGPVQLFSRLPDAVIDLAWHRVEPVATDAGFSILATVSFDDAPQADVLMVPGGQGAFELMDDPVALDFVRRQAAGARFVTSVCTGAFVLGAAGLLRGRRATTHWASHPMLQLLGAHPEQARVVRDGNIITGGGVTSGLDYALTVAAEVYDEATARRVQLAMEYDPHPPFDAGSPARPEADQDQVRRTLVETRRNREPGVTRAAARLASDVRDPIGTPGKAGDAGSCEDADVHEGLPIVEFAFPEPLRDSLLAAIESGAKTATSSLLREYEVSKESLPYAGQKYVVVDSAGAKRFVIETTAVELVPLGEVGLEHAVAEGEGYVSVADWREGHLQFWNSAPVQAEIGPDHALDDQSIVVLETFMIVR